MTDLLELSADQQVIRAAIVYNPFKPSEIERHDLQYRPGATLADYVGDLGSTGWSVGYRGEAYEPAQWPDITPEAGEGVSLVRVPESGGGGGKEMLRMVAMIAVAVVAMTVIGPAAAGALKLAEGGMMATAVSAMAAATFTVAGMMVVNAVIPPAAMTKQTSDSNTYGMDGPKNTSRENVVVPIGFGKYRTGGNITDHFTKNVGDSQYLYMRMVLNDGRVKSVSDFEINDQPIANYNDVETRVSLGDEDGEPNDWFGEAVRMKNKAVKLTTDWQVSSTEDPVDRLRFDLLYPGGLGYHKDDGRIIAAESDVAFEYRPKGTFGWLPLTAGSEVSFLRYEGGAGGFDGVSNRPPLAAMDGLTIWNQTIQDGSYVDGVSYVGTGTLTPSVDPATGWTTTTTVATSPANTSRLTVSAIATVLAPAADAGRGTYDMTICYRRVGDSAWTVAQAYHGSVERSSTGTEWSQFPMIHRTASISAQPGVAYQVTAFGGSLQSATAYVPSGDGVVRLVKAVDSTFRYSYESGVLPRGEYDYRYRRLRPVDTENPKRVDEVYVQDVAEIDIDNVHYIGTANVSLKIKLGEQLNSVSKFTAMMEASVVKQYDEDGNVTSEEWSPWPCWHVLDVLMNEDRGRSITARRIDFAAFKAWEAHCIKHGLEFNGVFDTDGNVWDVTQQLCRVGHAQILRIGTKYSVIVDEASEPVMLFDDTNILEGSFVTNWLPMNERANEIQYTFYPEEDGGEEKMIRVVDPDVINNGMALKVAQITEKGVTKYDQARFNIEKQLRENKLIGKTIKFDAPLEAIGLVPGDVAAVQHTSANYGKGIGTGRLKRGSTASVLKLDGPIAMDVTKPYRALVIQSTLKRYTVTIQSIVGRHVLVSGLPAGEINRVRRLVQGDIDVRIDAVADGNPHDRISVASTAGLSVGQQAHLYDTDVIEERDVTYTPGETEEVHLNAPLGAVPQEHAIWFVGPVATVKRLFRLREISGSGIHQRTLTFAQYDDQVYLPMGADIVRPTPTPSVVPPHVENVALSYARGVEGTQSRTTINVKWTSNDPFYAGVDIYMTLNGHDWTFFRTVRDVMNFDAEMPIGADVMFRLVAIGKNDRRAPSNTAPVVAAVVTPPADALERPTPLEVNLATFDIAAELLAFWPPLADRTDGLRYAYRVQYRKVTDEQYEDFLLNASGAIQGTAPVPSLPDSAGWTTVGTTNESYMTVPRIAEGKAIFRVRAELGRSTSGYTYHKFDVLAPGLPNGVTNLRLNGSLDGETFTGKDALFEWDDIIDMEKEPEEEGSEWQWSDYEVRILTTAGVLIRKEYTRNPNYAYTFEKNATDSASESFHARRAFHFEVRMRDRAGRLTSPVARSATNPRPALMPVELIAGRTEITARYTEPADADFEGAVFWYSDTSGFSPSESNVGFRGRGTASWSTPHPRLYFVRYGFYDAFDHNDMAISAEVQVLTTSVFEDLEDIDDLGETLTGVVDDRINDIIGDLDVDALTDYIFNRSAFETAQSNFTQYLGLIGDEPVGTFAERRTTQLRDGLDYVVEDVSLMGARSADGLSFILDLDRVRVGPGESFSSRLNVVSAETAAALAVITAEQTSLANDLQAVTLTQNQQASEFGNQLATANGSIQTVANGLSAEVQARQDFGVQTANSFAVASQQLGLVAGDLSVQIGRIDTTIGRVGDAETLIYNETQQRINADGVLTQSINLIGSRDLYGSAFILNESTTQIGARGSFSSVLQGITNRFGQNEGDIATERLARIGAVEGVVQSVDTLRLSVNGFDGRITEARELSVAADGRVRAIAGLSVNVYGRITGYAIDGVAGDFSIAANRFSIASEFGGAILQPFSVSGSEILLNGSVKLTGSIAINDKFIVDTNGNILIRTHSGGGRRLLISSERVEVYDENNVLRVRMGLW